jgi:hypothetical protein
MHALETGIRVEHPRPTFLSSMGIVLSRLNLLPIMKHESLHARYSTPSLVAIEFYIVK